MEDDFSLKDSTIAIFGLGLMGGSLAMSLKGKCARIMAIDPHLPSLELALSKRIIDHAASDPASLPDKIDLLIFAAPVPAILNLIQQLPSFISYPCIVMDIGSTKRVIVEAMSALPRRFDPIGAHPICGKEKLGLENADANLYQNAPFIITPVIRTSEKAKSAARQIIYEAGADLIEMSAEAHDQVLASTSHLPFLISSALASSTPLDYARLIGPGFRSTSRLAGTPAHMMLGILKSNKENVLKSIQGFRETFAEIESALQNENDDELKSLLDQARTAYTAITSP